MRISKVSFLSRSPHSVSRTNKSRVNGDLLITPGMPAQVGHPHRLKIGADVPSQARPQAEDRTRSRALGIVGRLDRVDEAVDNEVPFEVAGTVE